MLDREEFDLLWEHAIERAKSDNIFHSLETDESPQFCRWLDWLEEINARSLSLMAVDSGELEKGILKIDLGKMENAAHYLAHLAFEMGRQYEIDNQLKDVNVNELTGDDLK